MEMNTSLLLKISKTTLNRLQEWQSGCPYAFKLAD